MEKTLDKKMISHGFTVVFTPVIFSFLLALVYAVYNNEYSNIFGATPFLIFTTLILFMVSAPIILLSEIYPKYVTLPQIVKVMCITGIVSFILTELFSEINGIDYTSIILGTISGAIYYLIQSLVEKFVLNKLKFYDEI